MVRRGRAVFGTKRTESPDLRVTRIWARHRTWSVNRACEGRMSALDWNAEGSGRESVQRTDDFPTVQMKNGAMKN